MRRPALPTVSFLISFALAVSGCGMADVAAPLAPTVPSVPAPPRWGGSWQTDVAEARLTIFIRLQWFEGGWFSGPSFAITDGSGVLSYGDSGPAPLPLWLRPNGLGLDLFEGGPPPGAMPGVPFFPRLIATFKISTFSDTLLTGFLTFVPRSAGLEQLPIATDAPVSFRR